LELECGASGSFESCVLRANFIAAHDLVTGLGRAYAEGRLDRRTRVYLAAKVLVIDEIGYPLLDDLGTTIFFQLVNARYERSSVILELLGVGLALCRLHYR
jgi:DNA replication protein DnaC